MVRIVGRDPEVVFAVERVTRHRAVGVRARLSARGRPRVEIRRVAEVLAKVPTKVPIKVPIKVGAVGERVAP